MRSGHVAWRCAAREEFGPARHRRLRKHAEVVSVEYLNTVYAPGTPPYDLQLKIGALTMFTRNINFGSGLVNGKSGVVRGLSAKVVHVEVIAEGFPVKIPKIFFKTQKELPSIVINFLFVYAAP